MHPTCLRKTLSRPSFKNACVLKRVYLDLPSPKSGLEKFWQSQSRVTVVD